MIVRCILLVTLLLVFAATVRPHSDDSPIRSAPISADNGPGVVAAARERGATTAVKDIRAGTFRILYFGLPWSSGKRLIDEATGYRVQVVEGCVVGAPFAAEVDSYNRVMREWHAKHK